MSQLKARFGSEFPGSFFNSRELNRLVPTVYGDIAHLWTALKEEQDTPDDSDGNPTTIRTHTTSGPLYFRGQSNQGHGLSASLHRLITRESGEEITESVLGELERAVLQDARGRGLGKNVSPGQMLMILQHHFAPTRLLDISLKPLEALYFAVEKNDATDGRLFIVRLNDRPGSPSRMKLSDSDELPWDVHVRSSNTAASEWTQAVQLVDEEPLDPRMIAQRGRFLVGGVHRAYANLNMWFEDKQLRVLERQQISMLCMQFPLDLSRRDRGAWPALGWTIRIPARWKPELRARLANEGITHEAIYPELSSIEWKGEIAARDRLRKSVHKS